jgi:hypothetical protein
VTKVEASNELLQILNDLETDFFGGITTGDQSWFHYLYQSPAMFAKSPGDDIPKTRKEINMKQTMFLISFTNKKLLIAKYLPKGQKYNQDYCIFDLFPELEREKRDISGGSKVGLFSTHRSLKSHDGGQVHEKFDRKGLGRCPHPPYSPDLSPCDYGSLGWRRNK